MNPNTLASRSASWHCAWSICSTSWKEWTIAANSLLAKCWEWQIRSSRFKRFKSQTGGGPPADKSQSHIWSFAVATISAMTSHNFSPPFIPWPLASIKWWIKLGYVGMFYIVHSFMEETHCSKQTRQPAQDLRISGLPARLPKAFVFTIASVPRRTDSDWLSIEHLCPGPRTLTKDIRTPTTSIIIYLQLKLYNIIILYYIILYVM